jgi:hypothetical protein
MNTIVWIVQSILAIMFAMAASLHIRKREYKEVLFNVALFILSVIVALYRF